MFLYLAKATPRPVLGRLTLGLEPSISLTFISTSRALVSFK